MPEKATGQTVRELLGPVVVTTPSFGRYSRAPWQAIERGGLDVRRSRVTGPLSAEQLRDEVAGVTGLIVGVDRVDASVIAAAGDLKVIGKHGVGVDNIDLAAASEAGVAVVRTPGMNAIAVADLTFALLLSAGRRVPEADASVRSGAWNQFFGMELHGRTLGLVGFGRIGQEVAKRAHGFGLRVQAHDPFLADAVIREAGVRPAALDEVFATSDIVSLHVPMPADGSVLVSRDLLGTMRPGSGLVNTARGGLVDTVAAAEYLHSGHLGFMGVDAFETEPVPAGHPLLQAPNVVLTPHMGAFSDGANAAMGVAVVEDVARVLRGVRPLNPVQPTP